MGSAARFNAPAGVAIDGLGNVYVADHDNNAVRKITASGGVTTLAGTAGTLGRADGSGAAARFQHPTGIAVDSAGNVYVSDDFNATMRKITPAGDVTTLAGVANALGSADGTGAAARFAFLDGVAIDSAGNLYVADHDNATIRKITSGGVVTTLAGTAGKPGSMDGTGAAARFLAPAGIAVDKVGNVYATDERLHNIRKITPAGVVTTLAGGQTGVPGYADGTGSAAQFNAPGPLAVDDAGNVYVADRENHVLRKVTPAGVVSTLAGNPGVAGISLGMAPRFTHPEGLAILGDSLLITDANAILVLRHGAP